MNAANVVVGLALALGLSGCTTYQPAPLPERDDLAHSVLTLTVDPAVMSAPALVAHPFDASDGLDITEVAMLAVVNNPELRLMRADAGVSRAQAFAAGLLPDPQLALSAAQVVGSAPGSALAYSAGVTQDIATLLTRSSTQAAIAADARRISLELVWQEWLTVAKARLLFIHLDALARTREVLAPQQSQLGMRVDAAAVAVDAGLLSSDAEQLQLAALDDVRRQLGEVDRQYSQARHDLNALLGVAPEVTLTLVGRPDIASPDAEAVRDALAEAPHRRPDLLALQAGFDAQDARYRGALRAQFPAISFGPTLARDTSNVTSVGLAFNIALPLFNRNRGNVAIEAASRERLRVDYQQRLDAALGESQRLLAEQRILKQRLAAVDAVLPALSEASDRAVQAFAAHDVDPLLVTTAEGNLLSRRLERIALEQSLQEVAVALQALLGSPSPRTSAVRPNLSHSGEVPP